MRPSSALIKIKSSKHRHLSSRNCLAAILHQSYLNDENVFCGANQKWIVLDFHPKIEQDRKFVAVN